MGGGRGGVEAHNIAGDPAHPVDVRPAREDDDIVRDARLWQTGTWGMYAAMVFQLGRLCAFRQRPLRGAMDPGIKGMETVTA